MRAWVASMVLSLAAGAAHAGTPKADALWQKGDYRAAFAAAIEPAIRGDAHSQFLIGEAYRLGRSVDPNFPLAEEWYARAARQGDPAATTELGLLYAAQQQPAEALPWLTIAARRGNPRALCTLAALFYNGDGVARDEALAFALMARAAAQGLPEAQTRLATLRSLLAPDALAKGQALAAANAMPPQMAMPAADLAQTQVVPPETPEMAGRPPKPIRIQLGAFRSQAAAERAWSTLAGKAQGIVAAEHGIVRAGNVYRLVARLPSEGAARDFCSRLKAVGWNYLTRVDAKA